MSTATSTDDSPSHSPPHVDSAPKFGTLVPNRIFVGGILANTSEVELYEFFAQFGSVTETKIIADRAGVSKGYGFVTFESEDEARQVQKQENLILKDHKLNVAPAIRKQFFSRTYSSADSCSSGERPIIPRHSRQADNFATSLAVPDGGTGTTNGNYYYQTAAAQYGYANNYMYAASDAAYAQQQAYYQMMYPSTVYIPQQYYQTQTMNGAQWTGGQSARWTTHYNYAQNSSAHSTGHLPAAANFASVSPPPPHYVYGSVTNGAAHCNSTVTTPNSTATSTSGSGDSNMSSAVTSPAPVDSTATNVAATSGLATLCPYPPPLMHTAYPYGLGSGDLLDAGAMTDASGAEQSFQSQAYGGNTGYPTYDHNTGARCAIYQQPPTRCPGQQPDGSPRRPTTIYAMQINRQGYQPRYSSPQQQQQQHYYRQPTKQHQRNTASPLHALLLPTSARSNSVATPMTPPATPLEKQQPAAESGAGSGSSSGNAPITEATSRFNALAL